jgi:hypothetical protein
MPALAEFLAWFRPREEKPIMSRLAIALVVALAATGANAQDTKSGQPDTPPVASANGIRPFLFDGRMPGDGGRRGAITDDHHPNVGAIVVPPKQVSQRANDEPANPFTELFVGSVSTVATAGS